MMKLPWEEAKKKRHQRSEERGAKGGRLQINSGRVWHSKRDFKKLGFLFENRHTDGKSIAVKAAELKKITQEAFFEQSLPAMRLDFEAEGEDWTLIRSVDFESLNDAVSDQA